MPFFKKITKSILLLSAKFFGSVFSAIKNSYFRSLKGEENFWIVLFGWGVLLYVGFFYIWSYTLNSLYFLFKNAEFLKEELFIFFLSFTFHLLSIFLFCFTAFFIIIYPLILNFALVWISFKRNIVFFVLFLVLLLLFLGFHLFVSQFIITWTKIFSVVMAGKSNIMVIIITSILMLILLIYTIAKTIKTLKHSTKQL